VEREGREGVSEEGCRKGGNEGRREKEDRDRKKCQRESYKNILYTVHIPHYDGKVRTALSDSAVRYTSATLYCRMQYNSAQYNTAVYDTTQYCALTESDLS
jgi:hypothetical protein